MKIIHSDSGKAYHLDPDAQLEIERTNPFFNDAGEQSLPLLIPDSDHNRAILGYPDNLANRLKPQQNIDAAIHDGEFFSPCRQAVLGAKRKEGIETAFYMNEGAFFSRIPDTQLAAVFGDETVPGVASVGQGIDFCRQLLFSRHDIFAIFPVLTKGFEENTTKWLNRVELMTNSGLLVNEDGSKPDFSYLGSYLGFFNEFPREEFVDDTLISIPIGCYISPFIRVNFVLRRLFLHFGYSLEQSFFDVTYPFNDMVFINNTDDSLLNGDIRLTDLLPDVLCSSVLDLFRKKFACEFIPDERNMSVRIVFLSDVLKEDPVIDLSDCVDGHLNIEFPAQFRQIRISSQSSVSDDPNVHAFDNLADVVAKFPDVFLETHTGNFCRPAVIVEPLFERVSHSNEIVAFADLPYYAGGNRDTEAIEVPDCALLMKEPAYAFYDDDGGDGDPVIITGTYPGAALNIAATFPYIAQTRSLNSSIIIHRSETDDDDDDDDNHNEQQTSEQLIMLAFAYLDSDMDRPFFRGTITNYDRTGRRRLSDFSLCYNGPDGIFERFYRPYDDLLRNSLFSVKANLLLSPVQKFSVPSFRKVLIHGQELLINRLSFTVGGKNEPVESEFFTVRLYEPVSHAIREADRLPVFPADDNRIAALDVNFIPISGQLYSQSPHKTASIPVLYSRVFPPESSPDRGQVLWTKQFAVKRPSTTSAHRLYTISLTVP
jgi:hypothetical protein